MVKVSIIVPIYNVEKYLDKCIESLINQTLKDIEIILVNDGSPDNCEAIIDKYKKQDKRIISLSKKNGGLSSARNYGLKYAKGEYIGYVDSDDWVRANMFELLYNKAKEDNSDIVMCDFYKAYDNDNLIPIKASNMLSNDMKRNYIMSSPCAWNKIYKKGIITNGYWPEGMIYEDFASNPLLIKKVNKISYVNDNLYYYFIRNDSIMKEVTLKPKLYDILKGANIITDTIRLDPYYKDYYLEYEYLIIDNLLRDTYFRLGKSESCRVLLSDITSFIKDNYSHFMKNKYIKKKGIKYRIITYLIYKKKYNLLDYISRRNHD